MAAGTLLVTPQSYPASVRRPVSKYTLAWTSDASGNVNGNLTDYISGQIVRAVFIPGAGGVQPTDAYDGVLLDGSGMDVLAGLAANLSNATATNISPGVEVTDGTNIGIVPVAVDDKLELQISNAGNAKSGTVVLYVR
jgi:hypothetical protein